MALTLNCDQCNAEGHNVEGYWFSSYARPIWHLPKGWMRKGRAGRPFYLCPKCGKEEKTG